MESLDHLPHLLLHNSRGQNRRYLLVDRSYWTIGRSKDNDIVIPDRCLSRRHAILQATASGEFNLIDLGSRNGTFVNDRRTIVAVTLKDGDKVTFGNSSFDFHCFRKTPPHELSHSSESIEVSTVFLRKRHLVSVVVVDMRDFTLLARQMEDDALSKLMGTWFLQVGQIIRNAGSWVDKYIGDAVMAVWFHGEVEENKPIKITNEEMIQIFQAVNALNQMTCQLNIVNEHSLPFPLRIGVGINTGSAMVGNTGSGDRPDYTAIGDTVNAAFRLESATKQVSADLVIGESTFGHLRDLESVRAIFREYNVTLKGYGDRTAAYGTDFNELERLLGDELINEDPSSLDLNDDEYSSPISEIRGSR